VGVGLNSDRLQPFLRDVEAARHAPPVTVQDLQDFYAYRI
jgi:predicted exporter